MTLHYHAFGISLTANSKNKKSYSDQFFQSSKLRNVTSRFSSDDLLKKLVKINVRIQVSHFGTSGFPERVILVALSWSNVRSIAAHVSY